MQNNTAKNYYPIYFLIIALIILLNINLFSLPVKEVKLLISEKGLIEKFTATIYFMAGIVSIVLAIQGILLHGLKAGFLMFVLGLREMDFHNKFTTKNITKTSFYISPEVPVIEKIIVSLIVLFILWMLFSFLSKNIKSFFADLKSKSQYSIYVLTAFIIMVVSKLLDGKDRLLGLSSKLQIVEETLELSIPVFLLLSLFVFVNPVKR